MIETLKELIGKMQAGDWRMRLEGEEQLFELIRGNTETINNLSLIDMSDCIAKLINDANAKIQVAVLENLNKTFPIINKFILKHLQTLYKATI